jgi:hypothetical protein
MSPHCSDPDLQMAVLNEVRTGEALPPDLAGHLEECEACQTAAERQRRMVSTWEADEVDGDAMAAAAARFESRSRGGHAAPSWFDVVPFASAGVAAGYLLLAATGTTTLPWKSRGAEDAPPKTAAPASTVAQHGAVANDAPRFAPVFAATVEAAKSVRGRPHIETGRGVAPLVNGLRLELNRGEAARVALADGHASKVEGPCLVEFWSTPMEAGGWKIVREESVREESVAPRGAANEAPAGAHTVPAPLAVLSEPGSSVVEGAATERAAPSSKKGGPSTREVGAAAALNETVTSQARDVAGAGANLGSVRAWARAAAALREDDFDAADRAFAELGGSSDPATRDAARLARAQLWISRGREAAVRPVLEQLAQSGATALVRQRAAEFLYR